MIVYKKLIIFYILSLFCLIANSSRDDFTIVLPTSVATGVDSSVRWLVPLFEKELNKNIVVVNYPGADGIIGMSKFNEMPSDCNKIMASGGTILSLLSANSVKNNFDPLHNFVPIYGMSDAYGLLVVGAKSNIHNLNDLVNFYNKTKVIKSGSLSKLTDYLVFNIDNSLNIKTDIVNYKNASQMGIELSENLIDYALLPQGAIWGQSLLDSGKIRVIAVLENNRSNLYKNILTFEESGYKNVRSFLWTAFFVKRSASSECKKYLTSAISNVMNSKEAKEFENRLGNPILLLKSSKELQELQSEELLLFKSK